MSGFAVDRALGGVQTMYTGSPLLRVAGEEGRLSFLPTSNGTLRDVISSSLTYYLYSV
jgi:hypothetical protein